MLPNVQQEMPHTPALLHPDQPLPGSKAQQQAAALCWERLLVLFKACRGKCTGGVTAGITAPVGAVFHWLLDNRPLRHTRKARVSCHFI